MSGDWRFIRCQFNQNQMKHFIGLLLMILASCTTKQSELTLSALNEPSITKEYGDLFVAPGDALYLDDSTITDFTDSAFMNKDEYISIARGISKDNVSDSIKSLFTSKLVDNGVFAIVCINGKNTILKLETSKDYTPTNYKEVYEDKNYTLTLNILTAPWMDEAGEEEEGLCLKGKAVLQDKSSGERHEFPVIGYSGC